MATINTQFKDFQISKKDLSKIKGGYEDIGFGGGTGGNGFVIWDDVDPRDDELAFSNVVATPLVIKFKKSK